MFGLSFLSPLFLVGAAAAAVPILLHLFHRRADPIVPFAAMRYLRSAPVEQASRRRVREWLLLALRTAALVLLALAFARPYFAAPAASVNAGATVVLVDTSLSMTSPGQFERALERARAAVERVPVSAPVAVMTFGGPIDVRAPMAADRASALEAIAAIAPGAGATRYRSALAHGADLLEGRQGRLVVVTDLQATGWDAADARGVPEAVAVDVEAINGPSGNVALAWLRVDDGDASALVRNFGPSAATHQVTFELDGRPIGVAPVSIPPGGVAEARAPLAGIEAGQLRATVDDPGGYERDNVRQLAIADSAATTVMIVTTAGEQGEAFYLQRALAVDEGVTGFSPRVISGFDFSKLEPIEFETLGAVILLGTRGLNAQGRQVLARYVREGGGLFVAAAEGVDAALVDEALDGLTATTWSEREPTPVRLTPEDARHPIFRSFGGVGTLTNASFRRTSRLVPGEQSDVLARYTDGTPALVEEQAGEGRVFFFASDLNQQWNDFPLQPSYVPFVHEAMRYLGASRPVAASRLEEQRESDPSRIDRDAFLANVTRLQAVAERQADAGARGREDTHRLWQYGLLLMLASLAAEGMVARRLG